MLTKDYLNELKERNISEIADLIKKQNDIGSIVFILENIGQLPSNFDSTFLYELLDHNHSQVRLSAVKNIAKLNGKSNIIKLTEVLNKESDTSVRREIVSAIGRQRKAENKSILFDCLNDEDPKIICQAIRGLLVFENDKDVENHLRPLINHANEMVRTVIYKEYFAQNNQKNNSQPHTESYDYLKNVVVNADVLETLKFIPDESIHLTFTSPPYYNARDYSIYPSYDAYLNIFKNYQLR